MEKLRIGIELNHVFRDINRAAVKCYKKMLYDAHRFDEADDIDLDEINYKDNVLESICKFEYPEDKMTFIYEDYPFEIFGSANFMSKFVGSALLKFLLSVENQEKYDIEVFVYGLSEINITIASSMHFLARLGSRVRNIHFPRSIDELKELGDVFITANEEVVDRFAGEKKLVLINHNYNTAAKEKAQSNYNTFEEFVNDDEKYSKLGL